MGENWVPCVYIMASRRNGTLYVGVTSNLPRRVFEHREGVGSAFVRKYSVTQLVWYENHDEMSLAIAREKAIKKWNRAWKLQLIEAANPHWRDLYETLA
ncbi:GIY-YIG nuclease family protein [Maricaulaceae bacterium MS644]